MKTQNTLSIHADLQHVTIVSKIEKFGYVFTRGPMEFLICDKYNPLAQAYLEIGERDIRLHEEEPIFQLLHGYLSDGLVIPLNIQGDNRLPAGIYPLKPKK